MALALPPRAAIQNARRFDTLDALRESIQSNVEAALTLNGEKVIIGDTLMYIELHHIDGISGGPLRIELTMSVLFHGV